MITSSELIHQVYDYVMTTSIPAAISGKIYKRQRPRDSNLEDGVINSLTNLNGQLQRAVVNFNLFVPDMELEIEGKPQKQPDSERLEELEGLAVESLDGITINLNGQTIIGEVEQPLVLKEDQAFGTGNEQSGQHFINVRLNFFITNVN